MALDVLLVVPPCASAALPVLGPSILCAALREAGHDTHVLYANLEFAARVGFMPYRKFALSVERLHGEMLFAPEAWGQPLDVQPSEFDERVDGISYAEFMAALEHVPAFVSDTAALIASMKPRIVGFSSVFQQTIASVALAKAVRARLPEAVLLLGGANAAAPMGAAIAEATEAFDHVVSGEGEVGLPDLVTRILAGDAPAESVVQMPRVPRMDLVPTPVFDDFYAQVRPLMASERLPEGLPVALPFESSRGCWWGERSHCTFCGLNGLEIAERAHSPERVLADIEHLVATWGVTELRASDDLLPIRIQREVLPELARRQHARPEPLTFFYEVKSSMRRKDLQMLAAAGVTQVQAGLESLSTDTLKSMRKGVTGPMNIVFLREARAAGVDPLWNWMVGFPDDHKEDYDAFLRVAPFLHHLRPPVALAPVRVDRFSPYHGDPAAYGISALTPLPGAIRVWPDGADLHAISYHFTGSMKSPYRDNPRLAAKVHRGLADWSAAWAEGTPPELVGTEHPDGSITVRDTRRVAADAETRLSPEVATLLRRLDKPTPFEQAEEQSAVPAFGGLLQRGFVVQHEEALVSVVVFSSDTVDP
ncbi:MAG: RiPP maturation radical SAM C-methyltransferase [Deltaproteobacteria bacterium]|nr:RiPP maturation radical SAM C-methyltransferase [Deltaproteobacteria bacterium]